MHALLLLLNLILFVVASCKAAEEFRKRSERRRKGMFQRKNPHLRVWLREKRRAETKPYNKDELGTGPIIDV